MNDPDTTMSIYDRHSQARAKLGVSNKDTVFDALAATTITLVRVEFDGEGDSGAIGSVDAYRGDEITELPETTVSIQNVSWGDTEPVTVASTLRSAIETLCYDYLAESNGGWENDDGAYGEFRLDVAKRTVELEFNARYTDTFTSYHNF